MIRYTKKEEEHKNVVNRRDVTRCFVSQINYEYVSYYSGCYVKYAMYVRTMHKLCTYLRLGAHTLCYNYDVIYFRISRTQYPCALSSSIEFGASVFRSLLFKISLPLLQYLAIIRHRIVRFFSTSLYRYKSFFQNREDELQIGTPK